jgi:uncharacterized membrane protein (UPF0127 family)
MGTEDRMTRCVKNITRKRILVKKAELAGPAWKKMKGLMFRASLGDGHGLLMPFERDRRHEIWMLFMRFPIDIIFIGEDKRVVDIKHSARPLGWSPATWRIYRPERPCRYVLETKAGLAKAAGTEAGDRLDF